MAYDFFHKNDPEVYEKKCRSYMGNKRVRLPSFVVTQCFSTFTPRSLDHALNRLRAKVRKKEDWKYFPYLEEAGAPETSCGENTAPHVLLDEVDRRTRARFGVTLYEAFELPRVDGLMDAAEAMELFRVRGTDVFIPYMKPERLEKLMVILQEQLDEGGLGIVAG